MQWIDSIKTPFMTQPWTWGSVASGAQQGVMSSTLFIFPGSESNVTLLCFSAFQNFLIAQEHSFFKADAQRLKHLQNALLFLTIWNVGILISKETSKVNGRHKYLEDIDHFIEATSVKIMSLFNAVLILSEAQKQPHRAAAYLAAGTYMIVSNRNFLWSAVNFLGFAPAVFDTARRVGAAVIYSSIFSTGWIARLFSFKS